MVRTPENIEKVRHAVETSSRRSAVRHAQLLPMLDRSSRWIFRFDLRFIVALKTGTRSKKDLSTMIGQLFGVALAATSLMIPTFFVKTFVIANTGRYLEMLSDYFLSELRRWRIDLNGVWFHQDWTTSLWGDVDWPPRSPDLTPCDYLLLGYLKARVYENRTHIFEALSEYLKKFEHFRLKCLKGVCGTSHNFFSIVSI